MDKVLYRIAYLRSIGKSIAEISMEYSNKMTSEILDVLIEIGFNGEHITEEFAKKFWPKDKNPNTVIRIINLSDKYLGMIIHQCKIANLYDVPFKYAHLFPDDVDLVNLCAYKKHTQNLTIESCKKMLPHDLITYCRIALSSGEYDVIDIMYDACPEKIKKIIDLRYCNPKTIPERYFRMRPDQYIKQLHNISPKRLDLIRIIAETVDIEKFHSYIVYCSFTVDLFRYVKSILSLTAEDYYTILMDSKDRLFDELLTDTEFKQHLDNHYLIILYVSVGWDQPRMANYIINNYRDQIELSITDPNNILDEFEQLLFYEEDIFGNLLKYLARNHFSHKNIMLYCIEQPKYYGLLLPVIDMHSVSENIANNLSADQKKIFMLHKRKAGIHEWAQSMMTMIVMYSDGYFRINNVHHKKTKEFFEFVARLPLAAQSIIAFRYAWLPNCETILLRDSDFYRELANQ